MDPYWDPYARGVIAGLSISHTPYHIYRAILEGLTLDSVFRTQNIEKETGLNIKEYLAIGGGAKVLLGFKCWQMLQEKMY